jgi:hypothetical protein
MTRNGAKHLQGGGRPVIETRNAATQTTVSEERGP